MRQRNDLSTALIILAAIAVLAVCSVFAGKMRGTEPPAYSGKQIVAMDDLVHMALFNVPGSRNKLLAQLHKYRLYREMQLWHNYFKKVDAMQRISR